MTTEQRMVGLFATCASSKLAADQALAEFHEALQAYDWPAAEDARIRFMAAWESHMDQFVELYRTLEKA
jgi:hypothetical protein